MKTKTKHISKILLGEQIEEQHAEDFESVQSRMCQEKHVLLDLEARTQHN